MAHKLMMIAAVVPLMVDAPMVGVEAEYMVQNENLCEHVWFTIIFQ